MRIPDYRNVHGVKDLNHWTTKTSRVEKVHEDAFEKELEDSIHKRKSEEKAKIKKRLKKNIRLSLTKVKNQMRWNQKSTIYFLNTTKKLNRKRIQIQTRKLRTIATKFPVGLNSQSQDRFQINYGTILFQIGEINAISPSFATPDATPNKKWA